METVTNPNTVIPSDPPSVKSALYDLVSHIPGLRVSALSARVTEAFGLRDLVTLISVLSAAEKDALVMMHFVIGDAFNAVGESKGERRRILTAEFGGGFYKTLRQFGWVAGRWPKEKRSSKHPWTWWRDNAAEGGRILNRPYQKPFFACVEIEEREDGWYIHGAGTGEKENVTRISADQLKERGITMSKSAKSASMERAKQAVKDNSRQLVTDFLGE